MATLPDYLPLWFVLQLVTFAKIEWENLKEEAGEHDVKGPDWKILKINIKES